MTSTTTPEHLKTISTPASQKKSTPATPTSKPWRLNLALKRACQNKNNFHIPKKMTPTPAHLKNEFRPKRRSLDTADKFSILRHDATFLGYVKGWRLISYPEQR